jgi:hypothetical protein
MFGAQGVNCLPSSCAKRWRKVWASVTISPPVAQGRHVERYHGQTVIEILTEAALRHLAFGIAVGGADNADIDLLGPAGADRLDGAGLQEAQQLDLQGSAISQISSRKSVPRWAD